jgi:fibronectin-binding autotransporter adhesin
MSGAGSFVKAGSGTMTLAEANTYTGLTAIAQGRLQLSGGSLSSLTTVPLLTARPGTSTALPSRSKGCSVMAEVWLGSGTLTVGSSGSSSAPCGALSGQGSLVKAGEGILALTGSNSHTGGTYLQGGTLLIGSDESLGQVRVDSSSTAARSWPAAI